MGLIERSLCRKCGTADETSTRVLRKREAPATLKHYHLGSFFLDPEDFRNPNLRAI